MRIPHRDPEYLMKQPLHGSFPVGGEKGLAVSVVIATGITVYIIIFRPLERHNLCFLLRNL